MSKIFCVFAFFILFSACDMTPGNYTQEIARMEDTLFKAFPSVNRIRLEVKTDFGTEILLTLGDRELYNAGEEARKRVVSEAVPIIEHVFADRTPGKGSLIFTDEEQSIVVDEANTKVYALPLEKK